MKMLGRRKLSDTIQAQDRLSSAFTTLETEGRLADLSDDPVPIAEIVVAETDVGKLALHADDKVMTPIISETGCWEEDEAAWLSSVLAPGQTVIDCGANVGYFSLLMSRAVGPTGAVVAVEPEQGNLRLLRHNLWRNGVDNVRIVAAAVANERGVAALRHNAVNKGDHQVHAQGGPADVLVPCIALDELLTGVVIDVAKIDTQGSDYLVVAGMSKILERSPHAQMLVEFSLDSMIERNISADDILAGYRSLNRPIGIVGVGGSVTPATNSEIIDAARASHPDHWINIVIGPRA